MRRLTVLTICVVALVAGRPSDLSKSSSPVADAARNGDRETVLSLLRAGADVNAAQGDGTTALHWAALTNDVEMAQALLYAGANVKAATRLLALTPLALASRNGHAEMVETLLNGGADARVTTTTGATALMFASQSGSVEAVTLLLEHGADVSAREETGGQTALMFAAASNRDEVVDLLVDKGADPAVTTDVIDVPTLNKALDEGFAERLDNLAKARAEQAAEAGEAVGAVEEEEEEEEAEPQKGKSFFAKLFGWIVPGKDEEEEAPGRRRFRRNFGDRVGPQGGMTALLLAARQGNQESVDVLLESGADVNQVSVANGTSPLLIATMNGQFDLAMHLLEQGADPNLTAAPSAVAPLYAAINLAWAPRAAYPQPTAHRQQQATHLDLIRALLESGADPNARLDKKVWFMGYNFDRSSIDESGATPFWRAAYGSDVAAMELLRAYGADPSLRTKKPDRRPPVAAQRARERKDVTGEEPLPPGAPSMTPLHGASGAGYGEGFAANDHRNHPAGFMPAVRYLVEECGADVNARDAEGNTPLHNAAARGDVEMIEYLVSKGADVTILNREGQSTADMANGPVQRVNPFPEARDLLVSLGAINHDKCVSC